MFFFYFCSFQIGQTKRSQKVKERRKRWCSARRRRRRGLYIFLAISNLQNNQNWFLFFAWHFQDVDGDEEIEGEDEEYDLPYAEEDELEGEGKHQPFLRKTNTTSYSIGSFKKKNLILESCYSLLFLWQTPKVVSVHVIGNASQRSAWHIRMHLIES